MRLDWLLKVYISLYEASKRWSPSGTSPPLEHRPPWNIVPFLGTSSPWSIANLENRELINCHDMHILHWIQWILLFQIATNSFQPRSSRDTFLSRDDDVCHTHIHTDLVSGLVIWRQRPFCSSRELRKVGSSSGWLSWLRVTWLPFRLLPVDSEDGLPVPWCRPQIWISISFMKSK